METWRDIVAEMRGMREFYGAEYRAMADRIEAACKTLEKAYNNAVSADARHCLENAKLRRALDPVMNVNADDAMSLAFSVREAQAIMREDN